MTYKEVSELLKSYIKKLKLLKLKQEQLSEKKAELTSIKATDYSKSGGKSFSIESVIEKSIILIEKYEEQSLILQTEIFEIEDKIAGFLPMLDELEQSLIIERYMNCKPMCIIAKKYHYSYERIRHKYCDIVKKISNLT